MPHMPVVVIKHGEGLDFTDMANFQLIFNVSFISKSIEKIVPCEFISYLSALCDPV